MRTTTRGRQQVGDVHYSGGAGGSKVGARKRLAGMYQDCTLYIIDLTAFPMFRLNQTFTPCELSFTLTSTKMATFFSFHLGRVHQI